MSLRALRKAFRGVYWSGSASDFPAMQPVVFFANHHSFFDGHLLWLLVHRTLGRSATIWMQELDRFPFFASGGVLPFPSADARGRAATIYRTRQRFDHDPEHALIFFPEGRLHPREEGILDLDEQRLARMAHILPRALWCPAAIHISWRDSDRPDAFLATGKPAPHPRGVVADQMRALLADLTVRSLSPMPCILRGRPGLNERWDFSYLSRYVSTPR